MILAISNFIKYVLLGLIQGITEPLPISSSGHLQIFKSIFKLHVEGDINFDIFVNFGSLIAIIFYYRVFLKEILGGALSYVFKKNKDKKEDFMYCVYVVIATIPAGITGLLLKDKIDSTFSTLLSVGICLFITGLLLLFIHSQAKHATNEKITLKTSILMGFAQIIGLLPGISRSGSTTSFGVVNNTELKSALRFSFMMYIPISIASLFLGIFDLDPNNTYFPGYLGAFIASILGTYFAIKYFFKLVQKDNLKYFGYYCLIISISILIYIIITL